MSRWGRLEGPLLPRNRRGRERGGHLQIHNLHKLYRALQPETQARIAEFGRARACLDMAEFLKDHRNEFVDWRYALEGGAWEANPFDSDKALEALIAGSNSDGPQRV